jgi:hypothetical protein
VVAPRNFQRVADVVIVAVRAEHVITLDVAGAARRQGVVGEKRIEHQSRVPDFDEKTRVAEVGQAHGEGWSPELGIKSKDDFARRNHLKNGKLQPAGPDQAARVTGRFS